ncbi:unnamed protein product [Bursaphelenchus xylophilus]|uniref:(pine wood nematode) hypothetical protein n=1 Tax=Bursaphelenchus xylophilus TaxID=6326 RepID=A0A1I7S160_BURXY|nr:unnamed protein product [Bursaphelenchus xylophilus]CAG9080020.1 unnamed protein product [Bursaphelenchus xylophilus]
MYANDTDNESSTSKETPKPRAGPSKEEERPVIITKVDTREAITETSNQTKPVAVPRKKQSATGSNVSKSSVGDKDFGVNQPKTPEMRSRKAAAKKKTSSFEPVEELATRRPSLGTIDNISGPNSMAIHLFPRLSETNLGYHDIHWNYDWLSNISLKDSAGLEPSKAMDLRLFKRHVRVSHIFKFHKLQYTGKQPQDPETREIESFFIKLSLVDREHDLKCVSNEFQLPIEAHHPRISLASWCSNAVMYSALVRSNYRQPEVVLKIELFHQNVSCGTHEIKLLNSDGNCCIQVNKANPMQFTDFKLQLEVTENTSKSYPNADFLPDVLICPESWIDLIMQYRKICAEVLANRELSPFPSTYIIDPIVATFPYACEQPRLINVFIRELKQRPTVDVNIFRDVYMNYVFPFVHTVTFTNDQMIYDCLNSLHENKNDSTAFLSAQECRPFSLYEHSVHLSGSHGLE